MPIASHTVPPPSEHIVPLLAGVVPQTWFVHSTISHFVALGVQSLGV